MEHGTWNQPVHEALAGRPEGSERTHARQSKASFNRDKGHAGDKTGQGGISDVKRYFEDPGTPSKLKTQNLTQVSAILVIRGENP